jgi:hypothetical protein
VNERSERIERRFELPILIAAVLVIPVILVEESSLGKPWDTIAAVLNCPSSPRRRGRRA